MKTNSGKFYYSIREPLKFEVLCKDDLQNDQFVLQGLGSVSIKLGCNGKLDNILLMGTHNYEINHTYHIETMAEISNIKNPSLLNSSMIDIKPENFSLTNHLRFNAYDDTNIHYYIIYTVMSINVLVLVIAIVVICIKQIYFVNHKVEANSNNQTKNIELKPISKDNNNQPTVNDEDSVNQDKAVNTEPIYNQTLY